MNNVDGLIRQARPGGSDATMAIRQLIDMKMSVLEQVISALEMEPMNSPGLVEVISRIDAPEAVPVLMRTMDSDSIPLAESSMLALARSRDPRALEILIGLVADVNRYDVIRSLAASALGVATGADVQAVLREVVDEQAETDAHPDYAQFLLVAAIVALAKHGDHSRAALLLKPAAESFCPTQELAIKGLEVAVADGMIQTLKTASRDPAPGVAKLAAKPLFLLGQAQSIDVLHSMAISDDLDVHYNARIFLCRILGFDLAERNNLDQLQIRIENHRSSMAQRVCYRSGRPIQIPLLVEELQRASGEEIKEDLADELQNRTGIDALGALFLGRDGELASSIKDMQLTEGALYRWGHRQNFPAS